MLINEQELVRIASSICQSVLKLDVTPLAAPPELNEANVSACVQIAGGWQGSVIVSCACSFADYAAGQMFGIDPGQCTTNDRQDAIAELTNMIGGNVKGLLQCETPCHLSLPAVVSGIGYTARVPGTRPVQCLILSSGPSVFVITVLEKRPVARAA